MNAPVPSQILHSAQPAEGSQAVSTNPAVDVHESMPEVATWTLGQLVTAASGLCAEGHNLAAAEIYRRWLQSEQPRGRGVAGFNYGALLQQLGRTQEAMQAYAECITVAPAMGQAYVNLGLILEREGRINEALDTWGRCAALRMTHPGHDLEMVCAALNHIGRLQEGQRAYDLAETALRESLRLMPDQPGVLQHWVHVRQKACMWPIYTDLPGISRSRMLRCTSPLAMLAITDDPLLQLSTAQAFVQRTYQCEQGRLHEARRRPATARTRVGFISADLREHAVGFLLPQFLDGFDPAEVDLYAYDATKDEDTQLRRELVARFACVRPIAALSDRAAADLIASDDIEVLIDLHGLSSGARPGILALRPAPRQGTYLGFVGTTALPWVDFVLVDRYVMTPESAEQFTEKVVHLEAPYIPLTHHSVEVDDAARASARAEMGFTPDAFVMAAFGNTYKITPELFDVWLSLLDRIPQSMLWLLDDNPVTTRQLLAHARFKGYDTRRLVFSSRIAHEGFRRRLCLADVYLDTYPYNCGSTAKDVIDAGVPIVSRFGPTPVSRMGFSILSHIGRSDLAVDSFAAYADKVVELSLTRGPRRPLKASSPHTGGHRRWLDAVRLGQFPPVQGQDANPAGAMASFALHWMGASSMEDLAQAVVRQVLNPRSTHTYTGLWYSHEAEQSAAAAAWSPARIELAIKMISPSQADIVVFESSHPSLLRYPEANLHDSVGTSLFVATRRTWLLWLEGFRAGAAGPEWTVDLPPSLRILNAVIRQHALKVKTCWSETPHGPAWEAMALRQLCSES